MPRIRHLLLDRDGVLNREAPGLIVGDPGDWRWEESASRALALAAEHGLAVSVVTNQSVVSSGQLRIEDLRILHTWLTSQLESTGVRVVGVFACTHGASDGCRCRKPRPGLLLEAIATSGIERSATALVGDDLRDLEAAAAAGIRSVLVRTGKGATTERAVAPTTAVEDDLHAAVRRLLDLRPRTDAHSVAMDDVVGAAFSEHESVVADGRLRLVQDVRGLVGVAAEVVARGGTIFAGGNGGSASDAQHFVAELVGRFDQQRVPIRAVALGVDAPTTTAISNDLGFEAALARQLEALADSGDLFVALSTSGRSPNVVRAATVARELGCTVASMTGAEGGELATVSDLLVTVPSFTTARVQEVHGLCLHAVAAALEAGAPRS